MSKYGPLKLKSWGTTRCIFRTDTVEIQAMRTLKGGFSSEHRHDARWNRFYVISGIIRINTFNDENGIERKDSVECRANQLVDVPPGQWHQFEVLEDCVLVEIYWVACDSEDIMRRTEGGRIHPDAN